MWSLRALAMTLMAPLLLDGCGATQGRVVETPHFSARFDQGWSAGVAEDGHSYLFRSRDGQVDIHVFAWLVREPLTTPATEAWQRMQREGQTDGQGNGAPPQTSCGPANVTLFGHATPVLDLQPRAGQALLAAAQADGSLVAVVARGKAAGGCAEQGQVRAALDRFVAGLSPGWPELGAPMTVARLPKRSSLPDGCAREPSMRDCVQAWLSAMP